jgi:nucleoside diphosphate kinase
MILLYEGEDAVKKIRDVLGPTDPKEAPGGTVRRDFGSDVMVNAVHASDSPESAERECKVVKMAKNDFYLLAQRYLSENSRK